MEKTEEIRLTQYSHGAGCGCKIAPAVLDQMLGLAGKGEKVFPELLVGNKEKDDAAVFSLGDGTAIISTTDFFMPIVDDPYTFGKIAAANAISDVYAMGGSPMMAIAILGWPVNTIPAAVAGKVLQGAIAICEEAGIPLAGGHSIDAPEPIFGLAVTGKVKLENLKKNGGAKPGDVLFLTKPLGIGILTTAQKKEKLQAAHQHLAPDVMVRLNSIGATLATLKGVHAMTDVTGFGLAGHLLEMMEASDTSATIHLDQLPLIDPSIHQYILEGCVPGGSERNFSGYGASLSLQNESYKAIVCDPQTSGGLLFAVAPESVDVVIDLLTSHQLPARPIGTVTENQTVRITFI